ncbi:hypothetical protein [Pseudoxanthomonas winnipegensis]|uniref:hypothetical protein n=1 Tax=Pseudoxanthomonas winnipegensis TaxID=2480810 RepID=UPI0030F3E313
MKGEKQDLDGQSDPDDQRPSAAVLPFRSKGEVSGYGDIGMPELEGLGQISKRSDVTWLGESAVPIAVLHELSHILDSHPELWAMRILDHEGREITLWTGDLPNGYG